MIDYTKIEELHERILSSCPGCGQRMHYNVRKHGFLEYPNDFRNSIVQTNAFCNDCNITIELEFHYNFGTVGDGWE